MPTLRYIGAIDEVDLPLIGRSLKRGDEFDVPIELAGHVPAGAPDVDGYDPGEGLLAQTANYEPVEDV